MQVEAAFLFSSGSGGPHTMTLINILTCREKALISCNSSLPELPIPDCSHQSFFQTFQTQTQSRCLGAIQTGWGQDTERPSSGISADSDHLIHTTSVTSERMTRCVLARWEGFTNSRHRQWRKKTQRIVSREVQGRNLAV